LQERLLKIESELSSIFFLDSTAYRIAMQGQIDFCNPFFFAYPQSNFDDA